jgi:hypothetical protein
MDAAQDWVAEQMGWTLTKSWQDGGGYGTTAVDSKLASFLQPFKMDTRGWRDKISTARSDEVKKREC